MVEKHNPKVKERKFIRECIQLYRELPSLWNVKSKEYHDRDKKKIAYEILLSKYKEMFPQASKDDVKKKFNSLRTNYRKELKKHLQSIESGSSTDDIYEPTLWYFKEMFFLQDQESASDSQSGYSYVDTQFTIDSPGEESEHSTLDNEDTATVRATKVPATSYAVPKAKAKKIKRKLDDEHMEQFTASHLRETLVSPFCLDEYQNWALSCAADLKKMEPMQQIFAKNAIAAIMMEGQLGLLHRNSVKINTPTIKITPSQTYTRSTPTPTKTE
ncbi:uncharacterized protein [Epargyreus clarus]|uniref:uncharacterized protein isoform X5 n=1 Tax=Epargyreus clarus TaxID=520877 RepID=UPI003C2D693E